MKLHSRPIDEHAEAPLADDGKLEEIVARFTRRQQPVARPDGKNACYVLCLGSQHDEILGLIEAQGDFVAGYETYEPRELNARTLIGSGTCKAVADRARACGASLLVFDAELTPSQTRNIEDVTGMAIADREGVILNVFLRHARTRKARLQVEIAHLEYLRPRIRGLGLDMDQQAGGLMGSRGPGETASELLARRLDGRLLELRRALTRLARSAEIQRSGRDSCRRIVLLGYTNAGKTTLMNGLAGTELSAKNMPFETLDTTSRCLTRHGGEVVLSDTVGFIRRLPERLLESFASTLDEVRAASLLVMVVDVSDPEWPQHLAVTEGILEKLSASHTPRYYVFNKIDRGTTALPTSRHPHVCLSGHDAAAVAKLREALIAAARGGEGSIEVFAPYDASAALALIYGRCRVRRAEPDERGITFCIAGEHDVLAKIERLLAKDQV